MAGGPGDGIGCKPSSFSEFLDGGGPETVPFLSEYGLSAEGYRPGGQPDGDYPLCRRAGAGIMCLSGNDQGQ